MIRRAKGIELIKIISIINLNTFGSKELLTMKIMDFENVFLTKHCSCLCDRGHECIIYMISNQFVVKMYLYLNCSVKRILEIQILIINQHKNVACHV
jgi:hypothetical protein